MLKIALAGLALLACVPASATTVITFEEPGLTAMSNSPGSAVPIGAQLSNQFIATLGVSFSSGAGYVAVVDHFPPNPAATPTPPNIIGGTAANGTLDYSSVITASFWLPSNTSIKATTNFVKVLGDQYPLGSGGATLSAFDIFGNLLGSVSAPDTGPFGTGLSLSLSFAGMHSVSFWGDNGTIGFDNFEFGDLTASVPEPASWAMMIIGLGAVGAAMRRHRATARQPATI